MPSIPENESTTYNPTYEGWLKAGLNDGRIWANSAELRDVRKFAISEQRELPASAGWLAVEYHRRFSDFDRSAYARAWEASIGLVWLRRREGEDIDTTIFERDNPQKTQE